MESTANLEQIQKLSIDISESSNSSNISQRFPKKKSFWKKICNSLFRRNSIGESDLIKPKNKVKQKKIYKTYHNLIEYDEFFNNENEFTYKKGEEQDIAIAIKIPPGLCQINTDIIIEFERNKFDFNFAPSDENLHQSSIFHCIEEKNWRSIFTGMVKLPSSMSLEQLIHLPLYIFEAPQEMPTKLDSNFKYLSKINPIKNSLADNVKSDAVIGQLKFKVIFQQKNSIDKNNEDNYDPNNKEFLETTLECRFIKNKVEHWENLNPPDNNKETLKRLEETMDIRKSFPVSSQLYLKARDNLQKVSSNESYNKIPFPENCSSFQVNKSINNAHKNSDESLWPKSSSPSISEISLASLFTDSQSSCKDIVPSNSPICIRVCSKHDNFENYLLESNVKDTSTLELLESARIKLITYLGNENDLNTIEKIATLNDNGIDDIRTLIPAETKENKCSTELDSCEMLGGGVKKNLKNITDGKNIIYLPERLKIDIEKPINLQKKISDLSTNIVNTNETSSNIIDVQQKTPDIIIDYLDSEYSQKKELNLNNSNNDNSIEEVTTGILIDLSETNSNNENLIQTRNPFLNCFDVSFNLAAIEDINNCTENSVTNSNENIEIPQTIGDSYSSTTSVTDLISFEPTLGTQQASGEKNSRTEIMINTIQNIYTPSTLSNASNLKVVDSSPKQNPSYEKLLKTRYGSSKDNADKLLTYTVVENDVKNMIKDLLKVSENIKQDTIVNGERELKSTSKTDGIKCVQETLKEILEKTINDEQTEQTEKAKGANFTYIKNMLNILIDSLPLKSVSGGEEDVEYVLKNLLERVQRYEEVGDVNDMLNTVQFLIPNNEKKSENCNLPIGDVSNVGSVAAMSDDDSNKVYMREHKPKDVCNNQHSIYFCTTNTFDYPRIPKTSWSFGETELNKHQTATVSIRKLSPDKQTFIQNEENLVNVLEKSNGLLKNLYNELCSYETAAYELEKTSSESLFENNGDISDLYNNFVANSSGSHLSNESSRTNLFMNIDNFRNNAISAQYEENPTESDVEKNVPSKESKNVVNTQQPILRKSIKSVNVTDTVSNLSIQHNSQNLSSDEKIVHVEDLQKGNEISKSSNSLNKVSKESAERNKYRNKQFGTSSMASQESSQTSIGKRPMNVNPSMLAHVGSIISHNSEEKEVEIVSVGLTQNQETFSAANYSKHDEDHVKINENKQIYEKTSDNCKMKSLKSFNLTTPKVSYAFNCLEKSSETSKLKSMKSFNLTTQISVASHGQSSISDEILPEEEGSEIEINSVNIDANKPYLLTSHSQYSRASTRTRASTYVDSLSTSSESSSIKFKPTCRSKSPYNEPKLVEIKSPKSLISSESEEILMPAQNTASHISNASKTLEAKQGLQNFRKDGLVNDYEMPQTSSGISAGLEQNINYSTLSANSSTSDSDYEADQDNYNVSLSHLKYTFTSDQEINTPSEIREIESNVNKNKELERKTNIILITSDPSIYYFETSESESLEKTTPLSSEVSLKDKEKQLDEANL